MTSLDADRIAQWTLQLCAVDSTTGNEEAILPLAAGLFRDLGAEVRLQPVQGGRCNLLAAWGSPRVLFSTHLDTVPPFIPPALAEGRLLGRGTCDAKGILATMAEAIRVLVAGGRQGLGFLAVVGEETDSPGAKKALELKAELPDVVAVINGEPTGNLLATGQKGAVQLRLRTHGKPAHSGTPERGVNAAFPLLDWIQAIRAIPLATDARLGPEVWNLGTLATGRAMNVVPDEGEANLFARTVPGSRFREEVLRLCPPLGEAEVVFERQPCTFPVLEGFPMAPVPFGSDAHTLRHLAKDDFIVMTGPGSIDVAHTGHEHLDLAEALAGAGQYVALAEYLLEKR